MNGAMTNLAKASEQFSETAIDEEIVVMSLATGDFFSLEGTARAAWELIDGQRDLAALAAALAQQFHTSAQIIGPDLEAFVAQLRTAGLLRDG